MSQKKVAYVTGGMGGIGTAICQRLCRDGFKVIAGCGPSRDYVLWLGEQKALGYDFYASVGNVRTGTPPKRHSARSRRNTVRWRCW